MKQLAKKRKNEKNKIKKNVCQKQAFNFHEQESTSPGFRRTQKDNQIDWINCRIYYRTLIFVQFLLF